MTSEERAANASLIAAAPELLEALKAFARAIISGCDFCADTGKRKDEACHHCGGRGRIVSSDIDPSDVEIARMMPEGAEILSAQMQGSTLCLWALVTVNTATPRTERKIEIIGTGNSMDSANRRFISTAQMLGGSLVWHIFERL